MIDLYTWATPNGRKISIMLEEIPLPYEVIGVDISSGEQFSPGFLAINPNGKIPAIIDPDGPDGRPLPLFESAAILIYLADKTGQLMPTELSRRYETLQWLFFQMSAIGPMFGQVGFFYRFAGKAFEDRRPAERYRNESKRLLGVLEGRLQDRPWIMGDDYTIADIATLGWVRNIATFTPEIVEFDSFTAVGAWLQRGLARPAVQRGLDIPKRPA